MVRIAETLTLVTQISFLALWILSLWDYITHRRDAHRDITLMFTSIAVSVGVSIANLLNIEHIVLTQVGLFFLVIQPYMMIRLIRYIRPVPKVIIYSSLGALIFSWCSLLILIKWESSILRSAIAFYFVIVNVYSMIAFTHRASTISGVKEKRIRNTALGSRWFALSLFSVIVALAFPRIQPIMQIVIQITALLSAFYFYIGLTTPNRLRRLWQLEELYKFLLQIKQDKPETPQQVYELLCRSILAVTGALQAYIVYEDESNPRLYSISMGAVPLSTQVTVVLRQYYEKRIPQVLSIDSLEISLRKELQVEKGRLVYVVPIEYEESIQPTIIVILENTALFPVEDLQMLALFSEQCSILLKRIILLEYLNQHSQNLEQVIIQHITELENKNKSLNLLHKVTVSTNNATTIEEPLKQAVEMICKELNFSIGHAFVATEDSPLGLHSTNIWYLEHPEKYDVFHKLSDNTAFNTSLVGNGHGLRNNSPQWWMHIGERTDFVRASVARNVGLQTAIFIPVLIQDKTVAMLEFFSELLIEPDKNLLDIFVQVGTQLGRIIERQRDTRAIQQSKMRFRNTFEQAAVGMAHVSIHGQFIRLNQRFCDIAGYTHDELLKLSFQDITHPDDLEADLAYIYQVLKNERHNYSLEKRYIRKDGQHVWINLTVSLVRDSNDVPLYFISIIEDISERKHLEDKMRTLSAELEHKVQERTAHLNAINQELESFSYSVSHDLRAPLRAVDGFSLALLEDYNEHLDDSGREYLHMLRTESQRMGKLIDDIIDLSRYARLSLNRDETNLSELVHDIISELQSQEPERELQCIIQENIFACVDKSLIRIVLQNLVGNAWKYTSKTEKASIEFASREVDGKLEFLVRDNGAGFNMLYYKKLFGTFQRLHRTDEFEGTGIGLATVQRIIHRHGGTIRAEAKVNHGATFYFTLGKSTCS